MSLHPIFAAAFPMPLRAASDTTHHTPHTTHHSAHQQRGEKLAARGVPDAVVVDEPRLSLTLPALPWRCKAATESREGQGGGRERKRERGQVEADGGQEEEDGGHEEGLSERL